MVWYDRLRVRVSIQRRRGVLQQSILVQRCALLGDTGGIQLPDIIRECAVVPHLNELGKGCVRWDI